MTEDNFNDLKNAFTVIESNYKFINPDSLPTDFDTFLKSVNHNGTVWELEFSLDDRTIVLRDIGEFYDRANDLPIEVTYSHRENKTANTLTISIVFNL